MTDGTDDEEWNPEPVSLREDEDRDDMGHAARNAALVRDARAELERLEAEEEDDEWNPEPVSLRESESRDLSAHARGNIEEIRKGEELGLKPEGATEEAIERYREQEREEDSDD